MRILIFASPRSGSTAISHALSKLLKLPVILEPFNPLNIKHLTEQEINDLKHTIPKDCIVKVLSMHRPRDYFLEYINLFDKVIYLTRADVQAATESFYYAANHNDLNEEDYPWGSKWHTSYTFNPSRFTVDRWTYIHINNSINEVKLVANLNKKSYILYEDLYSKDINVFNRTVDVLGLDIDKKILREKIHPNKKYRKEVKPKKII